MKEPALDAVDALQRQLEKLFPNIDERPGLEDVVSGEVTHEEFPLLLDPDLQFWLGFLTGIACDRDATAMEVMDEALDERAKAIAKEHRRGR